MKESHDRSLLHASLPAPVFPPDNGPSHGVVDVVVSLAGCSPESRTRSNSFPSHEEVVGEQLQVWNWAQSSLFFLPSFRVCPLLHRGGGGQGGGVSALTQ